MKSLLSIVAILLAGLVLTPACGKDKKAEAAKVEPAKADPAAAKAEPAKANPVGKIVPVDPPKKKDEPAAGGW